MKRGHSVFASLHDYQQEAIKIQARKKFREIPPNPNSNTKVTLKAHDEGWSVNVRAIFSRGPKGSEEIVVTDFLDRETVILAETPVKVTETDAIPSQTVPIPAPTPIMQATA